jgi:transposase
MIKKETALLTEELLQELYLTKNLTVKEIASQYNLGTATINRLLKQYNLQKSEECRRAAIAKTKQSKTEEEKLLYSRHISEARKGKGLGV